MSILNHIRGISDHDKAAAIKSLIDESTPDFDFFLLIILAVLMATFGLIENNAAVVIGSMLIAPILFPVLSLGLSIVMSDMSLIGRATGTLGKALLLGVFTAFAASLLFGNGAVTDEIILRAEPTLLSIAIAIVAGFAVSYTAARPNLSSSLVGIAVSVALIPPIAVIGIGLAFAKVEIVAGALAFLLVNVAGIIFASMLVFSLMNLYVKRTIAEEAAASADKKKEQEEKQIEKTAEKNDGIKS